MKTNKFLLLALSSVLALSSCETYQGASKQTKGTGIGAAVGGVLGGIINQHTGKKGQGSSTGAVIGAVLGGAVGNIIGKKMDKQAEAIRTSIPDADVERVGDGVQVVFDGNQKGIYFDTNQSSITSSTATTLGKLVPIFNDEPSTNLVIVGHTDADGPDSYNQTLSEKRASSVVKYLASSGVNYSRLNSKAFGESKPVADNTTDYGKAQNRRVEIYIVPSDQMINQAKQQASLN